MVIDVNCIQKGQVIKMIKQKKKISQRVLASFLCAIMLFSLVPTQAFAAFMEALPRKAELFTDSPYVVIDNGYIACYVDKQTGGFSVLPSTMAFDTNRQASHATFLIDGQNYVFGQSYADSQLFEPVIKNNGILIETKWTVLR